MRIRAIILVITGLVTTGPVMAQSFGQIQGIKAHLDPMSMTVPIGQPVWVRFSIENTTDEPITLSVPGMEPEIPSPEMGLPLSHIFSRNSSSSVSVITESNRRWDNPVGYRAETRAPIVMVAPRSVVGSAVDLREYYPALRSGGQFRVTWQPYGGDVRATTTTFTIAIRKYVVIATDEGKMTLQLFYDDAPLHVENFTELVKNNFYSGTTFHRLEPGHLIQGGCPRGDGSGIRTDGKRVQAEFNDHPHQKGSVSMALLDDDPDSASCQFFISNTREKDWDGRYTVFAQLVGDESFATLDLLMATPVDDQGRPVKSLSMRDVRLINAPVEPFTGTP